MIQRCKQRKGFTLVELMLAMSFVSVLLLSIAMTAIQAGRIYNRGTVLRTVNQAGRDIGDMLRRDFLQTNAAKIVVNVDNSIENPVITTQEGGETLGARFCLGQYSYVWNTAVTLDKGILANPSVAYTTKAGSDKTPVTLVRVDDREGQLCQRDPVTNRYPSAIDAAMTTQLLKPIGADDVVIAVHDMKVMRMTNSEGSEQLYSIQFTLGTSAIEEINTLDGTCKPPNDDQANADFCAINKFDMIVRTNG